MGWLWKTLCVSLRNQFWLKPKGRRASQQIIGFLREHGFTFRSVEVWMGLADASGLCCLVFFGHDAERARFEATGHLPTITALFREALAKVGYPADSVSHVEVSIHSDEAIKRSGGYFTYFK
jgi:hypothetical protein